MVATGVPTPDLNVSDYCMAEFRERGDLPALVCGASGREITFGAMESLARQFGAGLLAAGLQPGDRIAVLVPNCPEFGPVLFGALGVGVVLVPVSPLFTPPEVAKVRF
jgi:acyl-CoA synthetase (AMP-forming)/AMP-acid ligase II